MMRIYMLFALSAAVSTAATAEEFHLVCAGAGSANRVDETSAFVQGSNGSSAWATATGQKNVGFADQVNIDIIDGVGKIRMPRAMLPAIRGGKDGWMELENLKIADKEITANAAVNFINSPKVRVDRITGALSISGKSGDYSAQCRPYDPASVERAF